MIETERINRGRAIISFGSTKDTSDISRNSLSINSMDTLIIGDAEELVKSDEFTSRSVGLAEQTLDIVEIGSAIDIVSEDISYGLG